jgi:hypothetical protein
MVTEGAVFKTQHVPFSIINFQFAPPRRFGGIENGNMVNYGNRTRRLHNISFSIINFPFAPPGCFGRIENGT